ncbi:hypothetical protein BVG16_20220 [Paenibacillus selenitireducens]|uniref:Uncharacterized protein n=1 Tax=Paenibacillus selenitireducens TaxID=1324314 RepID=A0A1T2X6Z6_9BACL|nr:DUF6470 family protein [Paenibacillus selenitireducens]OPA75661.1 hypothetical protein BVG16_20220 [Paenibacillus selenitireducens]
MELQRLSIRQTYGKLGMETQNAQQTMESPRGELSIETQQPIIHGNYEPGNLSIDSSAAWNALGVGSHGQWLNLIYSQMDQIALQAIAKQVEDGHRMGDITNKRNAFADIAKKASQGDLEPVNYTTPASVLNVKVQFDPAPYQSEVVQQANINMSYTPQRVNAQYEAGKVNISIREPYSIDIRVTDYSMDWES